jgi:tetratricopeptide (TPR) repeat protein
MVMISETAALWATARKFEDILRRDPAAYSFAPLADIYRSLGLVEDAVSTARKGVALHPDFAAGQMALAKASLESSFMDEAKRALETVVRITPENLEAQRLLADLYTAAGDEAAAIRCLSIISTLEVDVQESAPLQTAEAAELIEDIPETDILELTDDLVEDDAAAESAPFAALPDRPSLGEFQARPVPYMIGDPPQQAMQKEEPPAEEPAPAAAPVSSATIAELYISQGFTEKGADIYRELLRSEPGNQTFINRLAEITPAPEEEPEPAPAAIFAVQEEPQPPAASLQEKLNSWLGNIGRVKECRTKSL